MRLVRWFLLVSLLPLAGCAVHQSPHLRPAVITAHTAHEAGLTTEHKAEVADLCFMGAPLKTATNLGPTEMIYRKGYVLEHSSADKIPLWVCEHVKTAQLGTDTDRSDAFKTDPDLKGPRSTPADYDKTGYDRGHQAPAGNQGKNQTLQNQTFYMSNMAPQLPKLNRNAWKSLEEQTRTWVKQYSEAWEITGPLFYDPKEDSEATADGTIRYYTIGNGVAVPTHFYKIIVVKDGTQWKSIAFVMPNIATYKSPYHLEQYIQSVAWIEDHAGINFMPDLTSADRVKLEKNKSAMWP